jgi:hypothetical protein
MAAVPHVLHDSTPGPWSPVVRSHIAFLFMDKMFDFVSVFASRL